MHLLIPTDREGGWKHIVNACNELKVEHTVFDIYAVDWIEKLRGMQADGCIYRPEFRYSAWRDLYAERIRFMHSHFGIPLYPGLHELELYESKRRMAYWLQANKIPQPMTWVFGNTEEAEEFLRSAQYPLIFKTDFGNASQGVRRIMNHTQAKAVVRQSFGNGYRTPTYKIDELDLKNRLKALVRSIYRKVFGIRNPPSDVELDVVLFQEHVPIQHEWRLIKVGDSYFGHEKIAVESGQHKGFHSGSGHSAWTIPSVKVFDFAREVCEKGQFATMSLDIFETSDGALVVNELQTLFGVVAKNQMYREDDHGKTGLRYVFEPVSRKWIEEEGEFGQDSCYRLRISDFQAMLKKSNIL
jgi:hypothetical protein